MENKTKSSWQDLPLRILSALIIIPVALFCIVYGDLPYIVMIYFASVVMAVEWASLFKINLKNIRGVFFIFWSLIAYCAALQGMWFQAVLMVCGFAFIFGPRLWLGSVVIGASGLSLLWLRFMNFSEIWGVIFVIAVVIASDSLAYIAGKTFGGVKLMPSVSPGKTWSGAVGGLVGAGFVGGWLVWYFCGGLYTAFIGGAVLGMFTGVVAQAGDLLESKLKRELGVKDSGKIIPGHGGAFDRFDALLAASIFIAIISCILPASSDLRKWGSDLLLSKQVTATNPLAFLPAFIFK